MEINVEELWFAMVSFNQCCVCRTREELRNALFYRHYSFCEIAVLSNAEEAHCYAQQRYHVNFFANPHLYGYPAMPLPNTANTGYNVRGADFSEISLAANVQQHQPDEDNLSIVQTVDKKHQSSKISLGGAFQCTGRKIEKNKWRKSKSV